jgi:hypothetical protein
MTFRGFLNGVGMGSLIPLLESRPTMPTYVRAVEADET